MAQRFDEYMEHCLYDSVGGFYASARGIAGRRGDFITSPEVGPLFGAVVARALDVWWDEAGQPARFPVVDLGTGPGTLLRSLHLAAPRCSVAWELIGVDRANQVSLPDELGNAVVLANELLDNVPFRIARRSGDDWEEVVVDDGHETWVPMVPPPPVEVPADRPFPLLEAARALLDGLLANDPIRVVAFDYGTQTTADLARRGGWLRTYRDHHRGDNPYLDPGSWDITTDLAIDQLPCPTTVMTQAEFLERHGIHDLVEEGRRHWADHAARPDLAAMRMRSRVREADALLDSAGLGSWLCLEWHGTALTAAK